RHVKPTPGRSLLILFDAAPIFCPGWQSRAGTLRHARVMLTPFATIVVWADHASVDPGAPSAAEAAGGTLNLLVPIGLICARVGVGFWIFNREAPRIAEEL